MKNLGKYPLLLVGFFFLNSCHQALEFFGFFDGENLTMEISSYNGSELKTDGYYYSDYDTVNYYILVLYRNGALIHFSKPKKTLGPNVLKELDKEATSFNRTESISFWGVFRIDDKEINIQQWSAYDGKKPLFHYQGKILNDTTFVLEQTWQVRKEEEKHEDYCLYKFRHLDSKPDSVNSRVMEKIANSRRSM